jgi:hypothetical protein
MVGARCSSSASVSVCGAYVNGLTWVLHTDCTGAILRQCADRQAVGRTAEVSREQ